MSLRRRVVLLTSGALTLVVALVALLSYFLVRHETFRSMDAALQSRAAVLAPAVVQGTIGSPQLPIVVVPGEYVQTVTASGKVSRPPYQAVELPSDSRVRGVASGSRPAFSQTIETSNQRMLLHVERAGPGVAVEVARPLADAYATLRRLRLVLFLLVAAGIFVSIALGFWIADTALSPVRRLTKAAEQIADTRDLAVRLTVHGSDEVARLSTSFNAMLAALDRSLAAQRQLVADASHEFRTPLTSVRTNVELLARGALDPAEREAAARDLVSQLDELAGLVNDVIELARDGEVAARTEEVRLDDVVAAAVDRVRRHAPSAAFTVHAEPSVVRGDPERLARAIGNLLENAVKWNGPDAPIEVDVKNGEVRVRDHGPGIGREDLAHLFDRFYRSAAARGTAGSGLGLAIVRHVAEAHGGSVHAANADGGGAVFRFAVPTVEEEP